MPGCIAPGKEPGKNRFAPLREDRSIRLPGPLTHNCGIREKKPSRLRVLYCTPNQGAGEQIPTRRCAFDRRAAGSAVAGTTHDCGDGEFYRNRSENAAVVSPRLLGASRCCQDKYPRAHDVHLPAEDRIHGVRSLPRPANNGVDQYYPSPLDSASLGFHSVLRKRWGESVSGFWSECVQTIRHDLASCATQKGGLLSKGYAVKSPVTNIGLRQGDDSNCVSVITNAWPGGEVVQIRIFVAPQ